MKKPKISVSMKGNQNKKGFKYSDEQKFKIKQQKIANGFKGPTYGKKFNENTKLLMREKAIKNGIKPPVGFGKDSAHWKGGGINWVKRQVLIRLNAVALSNCIQAVSLSISIVNLLSEMPIFIAIFVGMAADCTRLPPCLKITPLSGADDFVSNEVSIAFGASALNPIALRTDSKLSAIRLSL